MSKPIQNKLSRLRHIGWSAWDRIWLISTMQQWDSEACRGFVDENDIYLVSAVDQLQ